MINSDVQERIEYSVTKGRYYYDSLRNKFLKHCICGKEDTLENSINMMNVRDKKVDVKTRLKLLFNNPEPFEDYNP